MAVIANRKFAFAVVAAAFAVVAVSVGGTAAGAAGPDPKPTMIGGLHGPAKGTVVAVYGKTYNGERFFYTYRAGLEKPSALSSQSPAHCSYWLDDFGYVYNVYFHWETWHVCSGSYGSVKHSTQLWRSSWSGWRGYDAWEISSYTPYNTDWFYWTERCDYGAGWYDYAPALRSMPPTSGTGRRSPTSAATRCGGTAAQPRRPAEPEGA